MATEYPIWQDRERPTVYSIDRHTPAIDDSVLLPKDMEEWDFYLDWINGFKVPLLKELKEAHSSALERFEGRGIDLARINAAVAYVTGQDVYPLTRLVVHSDVRSLDSYRRAAANFFFYPHMRYGTNNAMEAYGEHIHWLDFVRFRGSYINRAPKASLMDLVAHEFGHAVLRRNTKVIIPEPEGDEDVSPFGWSGYPWRYGSKMFGDLIEEANGARIAATARRELGVHIGGRPSPSPVLEQYREPRGYSYSAIGAVVLDVINAALGNKKDALSIYRPMWQLMLDDNDESAREELELMVRRAGKGTLRLTDLEVVSATDSDAALKLLGRVEEACEVDVYKRPSRHITIKDIM